MRDFNNDVMANIKNNYQIKSHWLLIKINWRDSMLYSRIDRFNDWTELKTWTSALCIYLTFQHHGEHLEWTHKHLNDSNFNILDNQSPRESIHETKSRKNMETNLNFNHYKQEHVMARSQQVLFVTQKSAYSGLIGKICMIF